MCPAYLVIVLMKLREKKKRTKQKDNTCGKSVEGGGGAAVTDGDGFRPAFPHRLIY